MQTSAAPSSPSSLPASAAPWCSRSDWQTAYPALQNWHWLAGQWPQALAPSSFSPTHTVVVEHPWQARWLQDQWLAMPMAAGAQALPRVVTLNGWLNEVLTLQYPHAVSEQSAAITVWQAVQSLNKKQSHAAQQAAAPTPGRWALAQQMVALLADIETLQGVQPGVLERLEGGQSAWLSREAQWLKAVRASLQGGDPMAWTLRGEVLRGLARSGVAAVLPAAHPGSAMQAFLGVLGGDVAVCVPDLTLHRTANTVQLVCCADFESEAQAGAAWVMQQTSARTAPKLAVVAHNRALARRLGALLARHGLTVDDRVGWALSTTVAASSVKGLLDAVVDEDPVALMHWLSLPAVQAAFAGAAACSFYLNQLWQKQDVVPDGAVFLRKALRAMDEPSPDAAVAANAPRAVLQSVLSWQLAWSKPATASHHAQALLAALAPLTQTMQADAAGCLVWRCMEALTLEPSAVPVPFGVFARLLQTRLETERYAPAVPQATVQFLPLHEAGWTDLDAVLMMGCNELHFPAAPTVLAPLLASVRRELGIPAPQAERANWLHLLQSSVPITASFALMEQGNPTRQSPWLMGYPVQQAGVAPLELSRVSAQSEPLQLLPYEAPALQGLALPTQLSVTRFATLGQCPYRFMLASVLGVKAAPQPQPWPAHREKGILLHTALHAGVQNAEQALESQLRETLAQMAEQKAPESGRYAAMIDDALRLLPVFLSEHRARADAGWRVHSTETQYTAEAFFEGLTLYGKTDRIDTKCEDGQTQFALIDYKTSGEAALNAKAKNPLLDAQLVLYLALLDTQSLPASEALYWRLHAQSEKKSAFQMKDIESHKAQAIGLFEHAWENLKSGAPARALPSAGACERCEFSGVCRVAAAPDAPDEMDEHAA